MEEFQALSPSHIEQLMGYLKFEIIKRQNVKTEVMEDLQDLLESRITPEDTYTGQEIIDSLEDLPDMIENNMDNQLKHQRDITMVLIQNIFSQAKQRSKEVNLNVSQLEDEQMLKAAHQFCRELVSDPERILAEAARLAKEAAAKKNGGASSTGDGEIDQLLAENEALKAQILQELRDFQQYQKIQQMLREREVELRGLKARL